MPIYTYKASNAAGDIIEDTLQATNRDGAATSLASRGLQLLTLKKVESKRGISIGGRISTSQKAEFARFMATMLRSGMSVPDSVDIIRQETKNKKMNEILVDIAFQTRRGKSMSSVLAQYKDEFDAVFLTMVKVGEESAGLDKSFDYLSAQLTASHELSQKIKGSLMYPAVIVVAMIGNGLLMGLFVLPKISGVFLKLEVELPFYTKVILDLGNAFGENPLLVIIATVVMILTAFFLVVIPRSRNMIVRGMAKLPVIRTVALHIDVARFSRTLSTLLKSGVSIVEALDVAADSIASPAMRNRAKQFSKGVEKGEPLSEILSRNKDIFPGVLVQTVRAGEKSGSLDQVLNEMAQFYESEVEFSLKRMTSILEPVLMLLIGVVVGVMVILMIAPIYSIIGGLQESLVQ